VESAISIVWITSGSCARLFIGCEVNTANNWDICTSGEGNAFNIGTVVRWIICATSIVGVGASFRSIARPDFARVIVTAVLCVYRKSARAIGRGTSVIGTINTIVTFVWQEEARSSGIVTLVSRAKVTIVTNNWGECTTNSGTARVLCTKVPVITSDWGVNTSSLGIDASSYFALGARCTNNILFVASRSYIAKAERAIGRSRTQIGISAPGSWVTSCLVARIRCSTSFASVSAAGAVC